MFTVTITETRANGQDNVAATVDIERAKFILDELDVNKAITFLCRKRRIRKGKTAESGKE